MKDLLKEADAKAADSFGTFFVKMLAVRDQAHVYHWQTESFAQHKAFGKFYEEYLGLVDEIAENIMGVKERPKIGKATIMLEDYSDEAIKSYLENARKLFTDELRSIVDEQYSGIFNLADEITSLINKMQYLITLKEQLKTFFTFLFDEREILLIFKNY
jgi:DNA-binding ferritin-like protein